MISKTKPLITEHPKFRFVETGTDEQCDKCALNNDALCRVSACIACDRTDGKSGIFVKRDESQFPYGMKVIVDGPMPHFYPCDRCAFNNAPAKCSNHTCMSDERHDGNDVHFEQDAAIQVDASEAVMDDEKEQAYGAEDDMCVAEMRIRLLCYAMDFVSNGEWAERAERTRNQAELFLSGVTGDQIDATVHAAAELCRSTGDPMLANQQDTKETHNT